MSGAVRDQDGTPIAGAWVEFWGAHDNGFYDVQYDHGEPMGRGHLFTDEDGRYRFWSVLPAVGYRCARPHIHFMITAEGRKWLITHTFVGGGAHLGAEYDSVLADEN
jgi:protocatechuate 3,4-dioxygenase beta subunit